MRIWMDRRELDLLPQKVLTALNNLEQAIFDSDWHGVQVTMERIDDSIKYTTTVDIQMVEDR